ncbi:PREDICTED: uncharacterized protein LOC108556828 [Nicrophorus vespilloides]|uniref:Uncharacterized protein LOC108556828 n=1 Tax=Nicrophorus vespilloides TaxID=110193 RepID=A0ABM1M1Z4_NICVS|nr:PREDICTED: uncharacterized protein LOC108556828 [Nicrophorus vespilloides]
MKFTRNVVIAFLVFGSAFCNDEAVEEQDIVEQVLSSEESSSIESNPKEDYSLAIDMIIEAMESDLVKDLEDAATEEDRKMCIETFISDAKDNIETFKTSMFESQPQQRAEFDDDSDDIHTRLETLIAKHVPQRRTIIGDDTRKLITNIWQKPVQMGINVYNNLNSLSDSMSQQADEINRNAYRQCDRDDFLQFKQNLKQLIDSNVNGYIATLQLYNRATVNTNDFRAVLMKKVNEFTNKALSGAHECHENFHAFKKVALKVGEELIRISNIENRPFKKVDIQAQKAKKICEMDKSKFNINCRF